LEDFTMARITFSPLVAGASGKAADAVFSSWKGTAYVRKLVTPSNPNSAGQQLVRGSLGRLPRVWRMLESQIRTVQNTYAAAMGISGYNWFVGENRVKEQTYETQYITPPNTAFDGAATITLTDLTGGSLKIDWTGGTTGAGYMAYILVRKIKAGDIETEFTVKDHDATLFSAGTKTIALTASKDYEVVLINEIIATNAFSVSIGKKIVMGA
jgi:hypothetical protein